MRKKKIRLLICDLDNTLYDWVGFFVPSFYAMVDKVVEILECDRERLLDDFRQVHQIHHDSEHPFALLETEIVRSAFPDLDRGQLAKRLDSAFYAYNSTRKETLRLHQGVHRTLETLLECQLRLVAHTESKLYAVVDRLRRLDLTSKFSRIYCRERSLSEHPFPENSANWLDTFPMERVTELSKHQMKPNVDVLLEICSIEGVDPSESAYVGDSMARDMLMAKQAGVFSIWAAYGARHDPQLYSQLVRISHWTKEDVERELELREASKRIEPDFIAHESISEIVKALCNHEDDDQTTLRIREESVVRDEV